MATKTAKAVRNIDALRGIVEHHQHGKLNFTDGPTCDVDAFTANAMLAVYDALNAKNRDSFAQAISTHRGFMRMFDFTWKNVS